MFHLSISKNNTYLSFLRRMRGDLKHYRSDGCNGSFIGPCYLISNVFKHYEEIKAINLNDVLITKKDII